MAGSYSTDLRSRVLAAMEAGGAVSSAANAPRFGMAAATSSTVFPAKPHRGLRRAYLERMLLPELRRSRPDVVPVMDPRKSLRGCADLRAHKAPRVRALPDRPGFAYRSLPAYSPDLNPIEPTWAKVKAELRWVAARTVTALHEAVGPALDTVTPHDAAGFFRHCG